jgi:hypothetical protein
LLLLSQLAFAQVDLLDRLLSYTGSGVEEDECLDSSLNHCELKCINGTYPVHGYTCEKSDGKPLMIDYASNQLFSLLNGSFSSILPDQYFISIKDIIIDSDTASITYIFEAQRAFTPTEAFTISSIGPQLLATYFGPSLGFQMNVKRIKLTIEGSDFSIQFIFPSLFATVSWISSTEGDLQELRTLSLIEMGVNSSSLTGQARLLTLYFQSNESVICQWFEDITKDPLKDESYKTLACEYYGKLLNGLNITSTGFSISQSSLIISDKSCKHIPPSHSSQLIFSIYGILLIILCQFLIMK